MKLRLLGIFVAILGTGACAGCTGSGDVGRVGEDGGTADAGAPDGGGAGGGDSAAASDGGGDFGDAGDSGAAFVWPACDRLPGGETLASKAAYFDRTARETHLAGDGLLRNVLLANDLQGVERFFHVENTILWSGMYLASQAFRYAGTGDPTALENAKTVVAAMRELSAVTGIKGLYGRSMLKPGVPYNEVAPDNAGWTDSPVSGLDGWRFRNDVSKDGYAGMMFGYSAALEHFDDESLLSDVRELSGDAVRYIVGNNLQIIDANGKVTEHGRLFQSALDDYPGFNALLASSWVRIGADATGDPALDDFFYGCLMRSRKGVSCPKIDTMDMGAYIDSMETMLNLFLPNCGQNFDNFDMCYQAIYPLLRREQDAQLRDRLLGVLKNNMFHTEDPRYQSVATIGNAFFVFAYAALTGEGPEENPVLAQAVEGAVCRLKEFPSQKFQRHIPMGAQVEVCRNRLDKPCAAEPIPLAGYDFDNYLWRLDPFEIQTVERQEDRRMVWSPEDYLVAYWLGRYHGIIPPEL